MKWKRIKDAARNGKKSTRTSAEQGWKELGTRLAAPDSPTVRNLR